VEHRVVVYIFSGCIDRNNFNMDKVVIDIDDKIVLNSIEVRPGIFHVKCGNEFDLAMTFLRAQEFYESDNPKIKGQPFSIIEYIRWYARKHSASFTYPKDWDGFNVSSDVIRKALSNVNDWNMYDDAMYNLIVDMPDRFYLIGTMYANSSVFRLLDSRVNDNGVLDHEVAHGFYYLNEDYKRSADEIITSMSKTTRNRIYKDLERMGYAKSVWNDEIQAYMVSGMESITTAKVDTVRKKFKKLFNKALFHGHN